MKNAEFWKPLIVSLVATPVCLVLGIGSAGVGHGDYVLARILFPYTMLSAVLFDYITAPFIVLAFIQFPLYGLILGVAAKKERLPAALILILIVHTVAALVCFVNLDENFSR